MENQPPASLRQSVYTCPTCGEKMERDLLLFTRHTDAHVVDELKKSHPEWVTQEGFCPKCLAHYKAALRGENVAVNIAGRELVKRRWAGALTLAASLFLLVIFSKFNVPRMYRLFLGLPFFAAIVCYFQVRKNHCVVLGLKGSRNMDRGEEPVEDAVEKKRLRQESSKILWLSFFLAIAFATATYFLF